MPRGIPNKPKAKSKSIAKRLLTQKAQAGRARSPAKRGAMLVHRDFVEGKLAITDMPENSGKRNDPDLHKFVRIGAPYHRKCAIKAAEDGINIGNVIEHALDAYFAKLA